MTASPSFLVHHERNNLVHHERNNTVVGNEIANITPDMDLFAPEIIQFIKDSPPTVDCTNTQQIQATLLQNLKG